MGRTFVTCYPLRRFFGSEKNDEQQDNQYENE